MKRIFYIAAYIAMLLPFTACTSDTPDEEDNRPILSYFKGTINNITVDIEQKQIDDTYIYAAASTRLGDDILFYSWNVRLPITDENDKRISLRIDFAYLHKGEYEMIPVTDYDDFRSQIFAERGSLLYKPSKIPFKICIDNILAYKDDPTINWGFPRISGTMNGILYNTENPKDSLEFKDIKFRVWNKE